MSVLKAPELKPGQDIKFDEAVRMLAESTAAQKKGLDRLDDLEREKITYILKNIGDGAQNAGDSVEEILRTIEKYRVLLTMKGEQTRHLTGMPEPAALASPHIQHTLPGPQLQVSVMRGSSAFSGDGVTHGGFSVPRQITPLPSAAAIRPCIQQPGLAGTMRGIVSNPEDAFFGRTAVLRAFIQSTDVAGQTIRYTVDGSGDRIRLYAAGRHIKITHPDSCRNGLMISGEGTVRMQRPDQPECAGKAAFTLVIQNADSGPEFRINIAQFDKCSAHDSGFIVPKRTQSDMCIRF